MRPSEPWNKNKVVGRKPPLSPEQIQLIKMLLSQAGNLRDLALFSLAIDSSLRGSDLVRLRVEDLYDGSEIREVANIRQKKTSKPVSFTMSTYTREALKELIQSEEKSSQGFLFTSQHKGKGNPLSPAHFRRLMKGWLAQANINPELYGSHSLRRSKISLIYKKTGNLRAVQLLLGHKSIESTKKYLGIEEGEAIEIAKQFDDLI